VSGVVAKKKQHKAPQELIAPHQWQFQKQKH
jgi:hypothetical protein